MSMTRQPTIPLPRRARTSERGSALVLALLVTFVILGVGLTALWLSSSSTKIASNLTRRQEALYAAQTGVDRARRVLTTVPNLNALLNGGACTATQDDPLGRGRVLCEGAMPLEDVRVIPASTTAATAVRQTARNSSYTVLIRNDSSEFAWCNGRLDPGETSDDGNCDGNSGAESDLWRATNDLDGRVIVRSEGTGADNTSFVAVEVVLSQTPGTLDIPDYSQEGGNPQGSNAHDVSMAMPTP